MKAKTTEGPMTASRLRPGDKVKSINANGDGPKFVVRWKLIWSVGRRDKGAEVAIVFQPRLRRVNVVTEYIFSPDQLLWCRRVESGEKP